MSDWAGVTDEQIQQVLVALLGGGVGWIVTWVLLCAD